MGVEMTSDSGSFFYLNHVSWAWVLETGVKYGWKPAGTEDPAPINDEYASLKTSVSSFKEEWCGSYVSNNGQEVTAADARALADALTLAILDPAPYDDEEDRDPLSSGPPVPNPPYIGLLTNVRDFCLGGAFCID